MQFVRVRSCHCEFALAKDGRGNQESVGNETEAKCNRKVLLMFVGQEYKMGNEQQARIWPYQHCHVG
jgi:hypothetical protein